MSILLFLFQIGVMAQDADNEAKPAPKEEPKSESKAETKDSSPSSSDSGSLSGNKNSIELKIGASRGDNNRYAAQIYNPVLGFLYQRSLTDNISIGASFQPTLISRNIRTGSMENVFGRGAGNIVIAPLDFVGSYNFNSGSAFRPFIRGYAGITLAYASREFINQYFKGAVYHLGIGGGARYYFSDGFFGVVEFIANGYYGNPLINNFNSLSGEIGIGFAF